MIDCDICRVPQEDIDLSRCAACTLVVCAECSVGEWCATCVSVELDGCAECGDPKDTECACGRQLCDDHAAYDADGVPACMTCVDQDQR